MSPQPESPEHGRNAPTPARSIVSALVVVGLCSALSVGAWMRDRIDAGKFGQAVAGGSRGQNVADLDGAVASRQNEAGGINLDAYYDAVEETLKEQYVEPIKDESKLAIGAVHGMVTSLGDPHSHYMDKDGFATFLREQEGHYSGIGADFDLKSNSIDLSADDQTTSDTDPTSDFVATRIPKLVINAVASGGPADKAGVKPGDWVDSVDGHWVIDAEAIAAYRKLGREVRKPDGTIDFSTPAGQSFQQQTKELRDRSESAIFPDRALTILSQGSSGKVAVTLAHEGQPLRTVDIQKADVDGQGNQVSGDVLRLRFGKDAADFLKANISGKKAVTIDLRGEPEGFYESMLACLKLVAPAGTYGEFETLRKGENPVLLKQASGNPTPPKLTLLVDGSVRGPAAIFALALSSKGLAKLEGTEVSDDRSRILVEGLSDGSGYTLVTGQYHAMPTVASRIKGGKS